MKDELKASQPIDDLKNSSNQSWCPIPWISSSTAPNGHYRLCVQAKTHRESRGLFYNSDNKPLFSTNVSLRESRNSTLAKEVRLAMLKGQQHEVCQRCHSEENAGHMSRRALARYNYETSQKCISLEKCKSQTDADGSILHEDFPLKELDLRMGNRCNLKCRSCNPSESSGWYNEWHDTISKKFRSENEDVYLTLNQNGQVKASNEHLDWGKKSKLMDELNKDTPDLHQLAIVGGEPLLIEEHFSALKDLVDSGKASKIVIDYNTNLTVLPKKVLELWKNFKEVKIGYSIDGVGKVNDYIRFPAKWDTIEKNLKILDDTEGNFDIWPTVTVMAYNVLYIPEIIQWQVTSNFKRQNKLSIVMFFIQHPLRNPPELSAQVLPLQVKQKVKEKYETFKKGWFEDYIKNHLSGSEQVLWRDRINYLFDSILNYLFENDQSENLTKFFERTETMDKYRGQSFKEALPELYDSLKGS